MIKQEFKKIIKSKRSLLIWLVFMGFAIGDSIYAFANFGENGSLYNVHPAFISMLSAQTTAAERIGVFWLMPIYLMLFYADKYAYEKKVGITNIYFTKISKKRFFFSKMGTSFFSTVVFFLIPILSNFLLNCILLHGGSDFFGLQDYSKKELGSALYTSICHPYITYLCYIASSLIVFGILSMMCQAIAMIFDDNKFAYIISFAIWIILHAVPQDAIFMATQPFIFYGFIAGFIAILKFAGIAFVILAIAYIKIVVKKDEI